MTLDDLDWDCGEIVVHGKGQRLARLPLPMDVGSALADYLRHDRPACSTRRVFIRIRAPRRGFISPSVICCIVRRALKRAGLTPEFKGAHLLRHSLATTCCVAAPRSSRSANFFVTVSRTRHKSMPKWTSRRCAPSGCRGRESRHEPAARGARRGPAARRALGHKLRLVGRLLQRFCCLCRNCRRHLHHHRDRPGLGNAAGKGAARPVGQPFGNGSPVCAILQRHRPDLTRLASTFSPTGIVGRRPHTSIATKRSPD